MNAKGQNVIEYILMVTAVVVVCIWFFSRGPMSQSVNTSLNSMIKEINNINSEIQYQL